VFKIAGRDSDVAGEYEVVRTDEERMEAYDPPPDLVLTFANLAASKTTREKQLLPEAVKVAGELIEEILGVVVPPSTGGSSVQVVKPLAMLRFLEEWGPLALSDSFAGEFSAPAQDAAAALHAAQAGDLAQGFNIARKLYRDTQQGDLLGVLALQLEARLFAGDIPKSCRECGQFFTGRRRQAVYCKDECRFKFNMRASRRRARARHGKEK
jgi:hypothetical protein